MKIVFLDIARIEYLDSLTYYRDISLLLAQRFKAEATRCLKFISQQPELPRLRVGGYRRINLHVFPYYFAYIVRADTVWIIACAHGARLPEYWISRTNKINE